jgi:hypothetical protein
VVLDCRYGAEVSGKLMDKWDILMQCEGNNLLEVIDIIAYVATMAAKEAPYLDQIVKWVCSKLSSHDIQLSFKRRCLDIAAPLLSRNNITHTTLLRYLYSEYTYNINFLKYIFGNNE